MIIEESSPPTFTSTVACQVIFRDEINGGHICDVIRYGSNYDIARASAYVEAATQMAQAAESKE